MFPTKRKCTFHHLSLSFQITALIKKKQPNLFYKPFQCALSPSKPLHTKSITSSLKVNIPHTPVISYSHTQSIHKEIYPGTGCNQVPSTIETVQLRSWSTEQHRIQHGQWFTQFPSVTARFIVIMSNEVSTTASAWGLPYCCFWLNLLLMNGTDHVNDCPTDNQPLQFEHVWRQTLLWWHYRPLRHGL